MFKIQSETRYVTMNSKNLQDYFLLRELEMPETIDEISESILTLFRMGFFGAAQVWGGFLAPLLKIRHTNPTMMKLGTVTPYLRKIQKM